MNPLDPFNQVSPYTSQPSNFFDVKYLNLDYIFYKFYLFVTGGEGTYDSAGNLTVKWPDWWVKLFGGSGGGEVAGATTFNFSLLAGFLKDLLYLLIIILATIIIYCIIRMFEIRKKEHEYLHHEIAEYAHKQSLKEKTGAQASSISRNEAWVKVLDNLNKEDEAKWRMAILDADKMLDTLTDQLGLLGDNLGDKLKNADRDRFKNLNSAWEAHNIRNRIAHEGTSFELTKREADRVVALYEQVFREFGYI